MEELDELITRVDLALSQSKRIEREARIQKQQLAQLRELLRSQEDARNVAEVGPH